MTRLGIMATMVVLLSISCSPRLESHDPPELAAYIAEVRATRTSAWADMQLRSAASLITGDAIRVAEFDEATGRWRGGYGSTRCLAPGADSATRAREIREEEERIAPVMAELRKWADADRSGFVSDREGDALRDLIDFGYLVQCLSRAQHASLREIADATPMRPEDVLDRISDYNALAARFNAEQQCQLPHLPAGIVTGSAEGEPKE